MRARAAFLALALAGAGCGAVDAASTHATQSAVNTLDDPVYTKKIDDVATKAGNAFTTGALAPVLSADTEKKAADEEARLLRVATAELIKARNAIEDPIPLQKMIRAGIDEATGPKTHEEIAGLREEALGAPLRKDISDAANEASSVITVKLSLAEGDIAADVAKYKWALYALGGVVVLLLLFHAHAVRELRRAARPIS